MLKIISCFFLIFSLGNYDSLNAKTYAISLGHDCSPAAALRYHGLREQAFPFDWNITPNEALYDIIADDFSHFLEKNNLVIREDKTAVIDACYGMTFIHDFPTINSTDVLDNNGDVVQAEIREDFCDFLEPVREKYMRRIERFREILKGDNPVFFFIAHHTSKQQAIDIQTLIHSKYPKLNFTLVVCGHAYEMGEDWEIEGIKNFVVQYDWTNRIQSDYKHIFQSLGLLP